MNTIKTLFFNHFEWIIYFLHNHLNFCMDKNIPIIYERKIPRTPNTFKLNAIDRFFYVKTCI